MFANSYRNRIRYTLSVSHNIWNWCRRKSFLSLMCYQLFNDVIQWNALWCIGKRLFHGKFIQFMRGPAGKGSVTRGESELGEYDPHQSSINFAVPRSFPRCLIARYQRQSQARNNDRDDRPLHAPPPPLTFRQILCPYLEVIISVLISRSLTVINKMS